MQVPFNPVVYFEIPVTEMDRAKKFYSAISNFEFEMLTIDDNEMALLPLRDDARGISGALAKGEIYRPTKDGTLLYFKTANIEETLRLVIRSGGKILFPKISNGDWGFIAEFEDSEGNRIGLHQAVK